MPLFFLLFILLIVMISYSIRRSKKETIKTSEEFWQREQKANFTRAVDISDLPYIQIPEDLVPALDSAADSLPEHTPDREEALQLAESLHELSRSRILNLTGQSNTELKLNYGLANLNRLTEYDENFTRLCRTLNRAAQLLSEHDLDAEAILLLRFAVSCQSDVQESYLLLASLLYDSGEMKELSELAEKINHFDDLRRASLASALRSYHVPE